MESPKETATCFYVYTIDNLLPHKPCNYEPSECLLVLDNIWYKRFSIWTYTAVLYHELIPQIVAVDAFYSFIGGEALPYSHTVPLPVGVEGSIKYRTYSAGLGKLKQTNEAEIVQVDYSCRWWDWLSFQRQAIIFHKCERIAHVRNNTMMLSQKRCSRPSFVRRFRWNMH